MAEETSINIGGSWKAIDNCEINIGGTWKQVDSIKVNIGGTWKLVWENYLTQTDITVGIGVIGIDSIAGFSTNDATSSFGSASPTTDHAGYTITEAYEGSLSAVQTFVYAISAGTNPGKSHFTTLETYDGGTLIDSLASASATYTYSGGIAKWSWTGVSLQWSDDSGNTEQIKTQ